MLNILRNIRSGLRSQPVSWPALIVSGVAICCVVGWMIVTGEDYRGSFLSILLAVIAAGYGLFEVVRRGLQKDQPAPKKKTPLEKLQEWDERDSPF